MCGSLSILWDWKNTGYSFPKLKVSFRSDAPKPPPPRPQSPARVSTQQGHPRAVAPGGGWNRELTRAQGCRLLGPGPSRLPPGPRVHSRPWLLLLLLLLASGPGQEAPQRPERGGGGRQDGTAIQHHELCTGRLLHHLGLHLPAVPAHRLLRPRRARRQDTRP